MMMLRKMTDCESSKISQEIFYDEVFFCKIASLECLHCNFSLKKLTTDSFWNMHRELDVLKRIKREKVFFRKTIWVSDLIKLQSCVVHNPQFYQKSGARLRDSRRSAESSNIFKGKPPCWRLLPLKLQA